MNLSEFDVFSTKQSNYLPHEELSPCENLLKLANFSSTKSSFFPIDKPPSPAPLIIRKKPSFKDEIKVNFMQQSKTLGDTQQIDPITIRASVLNETNKNTNNMNKTTTSSIDFAFNSVEFSKPFPLPTLNTLERELQQELMLKPSNKEETDNNYNERGIFLKNKAKQLEEDFNNNALKEQENFISKITEMLEYTSSKGFSLSIFFKICIFLLDIISFSVSPLTTNITDRRPLIPPVLMEKTQEEEDEDENSQINLNLNMQQISTEEYYAQESSIKSSSPKFNEHYLHEIENIMHLQEKNKEKNYDYFENFPDSNTKSVFSQPYDYNSGDKFEENRKFSNISDKKQQESEELFHNVRPKTSSFSFVNSNNFVCKKLDFEEQNNGLSFLPKIKEKQFSFAETNPIQNSSYLEENSSNLTQNKEKNLYEILLNKVYNEKNANISQIPPNNHKNSNTSFNINNNSQRKSNRPLKKSSITTTKKTDKKLNKREISQYIEKIMSEAHKYKENKENNEASLPAKTKKKTVSNVQNTILITNNHNYNNYATEQNKSKKNEAFQRENCSNHGKNKAKVLHLTLGEEPVILAVNMNEKLDNSQRKTSSRRRISSNRRKSNYIN